MEPENNPIHATEDMIPRLQDDVMNEWEAFFMQAQVDFDEHIEAIKDEYNDLRWEAGEPGYAWTGKKPSQARQKAARKRQGELATGAHLEPVVRLAVRLCRATSADPPTLTYLQAARGWHLVDAMLRGFCEKMTTNAGKPVPTNALDEGAAGLLSGIAMDVWRDHRLSVNTERDKALKAWEHRFLPAEPEPLPQDDRPRPDAWIVAVANGEMTPQEVAERWLRGEQPMATSDEPA